MDESPSDMTRALRPYRRLLQEFISGEISADDFEASFVARYLADETLWPPKLFDILDELFAEVDDYVGDPELRARVGGLNGTELVVCADNAARRLDEYTGISA